jgi:hypothetical protein
MVSVRGHGYFCAAQRSRDCKEGPDTLSGGLPALTSHHRIVPRMVPFVVHCTVHATLVHWAHVLHFSLDPLHLRCHRSFRKAAGARGMRRSSTRGGDGSVEHLGPSFRESRGYRTTLRVRVVVGRDEMKTRKKQFYIDHVDRAHLSIRGSPRLPSMPPPFPSSTVSLSMQSRARTCANNKQQEQGQRHDVAAK